MPPQWPLGYFYAVRTAIRKLSCRPTLEIESLLYKIERLLARKSALPAPRCSVPIRWVETDELLLEINANILPHS
jgi:hypothetical protein